MSDHPSSLKLVGALGLRVVSRTPSGIKTACAFCSSSDAQNVRDGTDGRPVAKCFSCDCGGGALDLAEAVLGNRRQAIELLERVGIFEPRASSNGTTTGRRRETVWPIRDPSGAVVAEHVRIDEPDGSKRFTWRRNGRSGLDGLKAAALPLYGCERLNGQAAARVVVVEGEKSTDALRSRGVLAVGTVTGSSSCPSIESLEVLRGRPVLVWPDNDETGTKHARKLAERLDGIAESVRVVLWSDAPPKGDAANFNGSDDDLRALLDAAQPIDAHERDVDAWPVPRPLVSTEALPELDLDTCFPDRLARVREYVRSVAVALQVPADAVALLSLGIASATLMRRLEIEGQDDWREPLALWAIPQLPSGERKSALLAELARPIRDWQKARTRVLRDDVAKSSARIDTAEKRLTIEKQKCAKGDGSIEDVERLAAEVEDEKANAPRLPSLIVTDATSEALAKCIMDNGERALIASAEGDALEVALGRYSDGTESFGIWLAGHAGDPYEDSRISRTGISIQRTTLAVALCIQPDAVEGLFASRKARGLGFLARGLWSTPRSSVGRRELRPTPVPEHLRAAWRATLERGLDAGANLKGDEEPEIIRLDPEADRLLLKFRGDVENALRPDGELGDLRDWGSKLPGAVLRIAGVLAGLTLEAGVVPAVDAETMRAALEWAPYLIAHALHVHRLAGEDPAVGIAERVLRWILRERLSGFSKRDAWRACRGGPVGKAAHLDEPLELLEEFGWIRTEPEPEADRKKPGRKPSPRFRVNPTPMGPNGQNDHNPKGARGAGSSGRTGHSGPRMRSEGHAEDSPPDRDADADLRAELDRLLEVEP